MYFKKPKFIKKPKMSAAGRNFYHRQQFSRISGGGAIALCNVYPFSSADSDYLEIESYTGNLKIILAATSETGIPAAIVAGRQGVFTPSIDPVNDPQWVQYEINGVIPAIILEATFTGVCGDYAKDNVWSSVDMGEPTVIPATYYAMLNANYFNASFSAITLANTDILSVNITGLDSSSSFMYFLGSESSASFWYRGSDGRMRITSDAGLSLTFFSVTEINDGGQHYLEVRLTPTGVTLWVDGVEKSTANGAIDTFSFSSIGARSSSSSSMSKGSVFGVTLGNQASWSMVDVSPSLNAEDSIGSNDLTYNGAPATPEQSDFIEVVTE